MGLSGRRASWIVLSVLILLSGCDVIGGPALTLEVRSLPGEGKGFDPPTVISPPDTLVALTFTNVSTLDHTLFFLDPIKVRSREFVRPGESERLVFRTPGAGSYVFVCTVHEGMRGTLLVR